MHPMLWSRQPGHARVGLVVLGLLLAPLAVLLPPGPAYGDHIQGPRMVDVAVGAGHACAFSEEGNVWCWGDNEFGQLGAGPEPARMSTPQQVADIDDATSLVAGAHHTCAVREAGSVSCWGRNGSGQLGNASTADSSLPVDVSDLEDVTELAAGRAHTCALQGNEDAIWCWGANGFGQLGLGSVRDAELYLGSDGDGRALGHDSVDAGEDGTVLVGAGLGRTWAFDDDGQLRQAWRVSTPDIPSGGVRGGPVAATGDGGGWVADREPGSPRVFRLEPDGTHEPAVDPLDPAMGCRDADPCRVQGLAALPQGGVVVLMTQGAPASSVWLRRLDASGVPTGSTVKVPGSASQVTDVAVSPNETGSSRSVFVAAGERVLRFTTAALAYQSEFSVRRLGEPCSVHDDYVVEGEPLSDEPGETDSTWTYTHTKSDLVGSRLGSGPDGSVSMLLEYKKTTSVLVEVAPTEPKPEAPVDDGRNYTALETVPQPICLVRADAFGPGSGTLDGYPGSAAEGTDLHASHDVTSMPDGGFVVSDDDAFEAGPRRSRLLRLDAQGAEVASYGRVSFRSLPAEVRPAAVLRQDRIGTNRFTSLTAGTHHTCAFLETRGAAQDGNEIACWGSDGAGQLGRDPERTTSPLSPPTDQIGSQSSFPVLMGLPGLAQYEGTLAAGGNHTCQRRADVVSCFGAGEDGQLGGSPTGEGRRVEQDLVATQVEAGDRFTCAVVSDAVSCWGNDDSEQLGPQLWTLPDVSRVNAGRATACAVAAGDVHCWGSREQDQFPGEPSDLSSRAPVGIVVPEPGFSTDPPSALTDGFLVTFSAAVSGVTPESVLLSSVTTGFPVPVTLECRDVLDAPVGCATDMVRSVLLQPLVPLVPGEQYAVTVNPDGVDPVEAGGLPVESRVDPVQAPTSFDDAELAGYAAWGRRQSARASQGEYVAERTARASLTYRFRGDRLVLVGTHGPRFGRASVTVDDQTPQRIDFFAPTMRYRVPHPIEVAGPGPHEVTVKVLGRARPRASDTYVGVDGFRVGRRSFGAPSVAASWGTTAVDGAVGGSVSRSSTRGSSLTVPFHGTGITWTSVVGPDQGDVRLVVDGVRREVVGNDAEAAGLVDRTVDGLDPGLHTLRVVALNRGPGTGTLVSVDSFDVQR